MPVAGPILTLAARSGCEAEPDNRPCTGLEPWIPPGLVLASLAQLSGVALLTAALLYDAKPSDPVTVSPSFDTSRLGVEVRGRW